MILCASFLALVLLVAPAGPAGPRIVIAQIETPRLRFSVKLDPAVASHSVDGRLFVFLSQRDDGEPRFGPDWFRPEPFFGMDVHGFVPGSERVIDSKADGFPTSLQRIEPGEYRVQAVFDRGFYAQHHAKEPGNFYSSIVTCKLDAAHPVECELILSHIVGDEPFSETSWRKEVIVPSKLLSDFHGRTAVHRAAVVLPREYDHAANRRYPAIYYIHGFGGSHRRGLRMDEPPAVKKGEDEFIRVYLNADCKWGHHVFADSATNGPRGRALVDELIPYIDATYRTLSDSRARFVTGHSSGGWSSLWLQVAHPDTFGGTWSTSPDPVDFRDFQQVNLYADPPLSLYYDEAGQRRPIARRGKEPALWFESFGRMDDVLKRGGQLRSFEAVFSPLDVDGEPQMLWDRSTGRINPQVAEAWSKYDITRRISKNWPTLQSKLAGKLHVYTGELDTFYLEGAVELLAKELDRLGSDAKVEIIDSKNHSNLRDAAMEHRILCEMSSAYRRHFPTVSEPISDMPWERDHADEPHSVTE